MHACSSRLSACQLVADSSGGAGRHAHDSKPLINDERENKQIVISLREVAAGLIVADNSEYDEQMHFYNPESGPLRRNFQMMDEDLPPEF